MNKFVHYVKIWMKEHALFWKEKQNDLIIV